MNTKTLVQAAILLNIILTIHCEQKLHPANDENLSHIDNLQPGSNAYSNNIDNMDITSAAVPAAANRPSIVTRTATKRGEKKLEHHQKVLQYRRIQQKPKQHQQQQKQQQQQHRIRRMIGRNTTCFRRLVKFCKMVTYKDVTKRFCLRVPVKYCTALD